MPVQGYTLPYLIACTRGHFTFIFTVNKEVVQLLANWLCLLQIVSRDLAMFQPSIKGDYLDARFLFVIRDFNVGSDTVI